LRDYTSYKFERGEKIISRVFALRNKGYKIKEIAKKSGLTFRQVAYVLYQLNKRRR